ncbi:MAG TPA: hypothetical protein VGL42_08880 [Opitutaceae bacterium]|jgi:hypothetical protein
MLALVAVLAFQVPDWAIPGSPTHQQVPPPPGFHRVTRTEEIPIGLFAGQSDIGAALVPGSSRYESDRHRYILQSAGYNVWYTRDEFRYLWRKTTGDCAIAATAQFPVPGGYYDRMAVLAIRASLDDDAKEVVAVLHGAGIIHLSGRSAPGTSLHRAARLKVGEVTGPETQRFGLRKQGDKFQLLVSLSGEPLHPAGDPLVLPFQGDFYVGIGACSHEPATLDTVVLSDVTLDLGNEAARAVHALPAP